MSKADLYVQMSRHESFCMTLAEAQILGIPAVSTNFDAAYEIVDDGVTGYIVDGNPDSLYEKIYELITNQECYSSLLNNAKKYEFKANSSSSDFERLINLV